jgi:hypothetical protein
MSRRVWRRDWRRQQLVGKPAEQEQPRDRDDGDDELDEDEHATHRR